MARKLTTVEAHHVPTIAEDLDEIQRTHDFDSADAPHQPEVLLFARASERVAAELRRVPVTVTAEILPGKPDPPSAQARFANSSRAGQYAKLLEATGDYTTIYLDDGDTKWTVNHGQNTQHGAGDR